MQCGTGTPAGAELHTCACAPVPLPHPRTVRVLRLSSRRVRSFTSRRRLLSLRAAHVRSIDRVFRRVNRHALGTRVLVLPPQMFSSPLLRVQQLFLLLFEFQLSIHHFFIILLVCWINGLAVLYINFCQNNWPTFISNLICS